MARCSFAAFNAWRAALDHAPTADEVRKHFGCSSNTALDWISRQPGPARNDAAARAATETVFAYLRALAEPRTVGEIATGCGLPTKTVTHAVQNLYEAARVVRGGLSKPYTYRVADALPDLSLLPGPAQPAGGLVASLGVPMAAHHTTRIAA